MAKEEKSAQPAYGSDLRKLSGLLERVLEIFEKDRKLAEDNYKSLRAQLDNILDKDMESSEDGKIEGEVNRALKLVFDSATRLQGVIDTTSRVIIAQLNADAKRDVAAMFNQGGGIRKVNIQNLLDGDDEPKLLGEEDGGE